jgi:AGCS family alanine or glycine:cation symporter
MALCTTLGVGNIAGVCVSLALGGPGAVVWIWVAGFLGMIIKYGEITLGVKYREINPETGMYRGGIMWYVGKGLSRKWKWIGVLYAAFYVVVIINAPAVQVNTMASAASSYFKIPPLLIGVTMAALIALVLIGGLRRVSVFAEKIVMVMSFLYFLVTIVVLILYLPEIPRAFGLIFKYAFTDAKAIVGGFGGASVAMAFRHGLARGFYSNGAGSGDAPFAHSSSDVDHPVKQGLWGISEVVVDTLVCTISALIVLVTGVWTSQGIGVNLFITAVSAAFDSQFFANVFVIIIVFFFAFSTAVMCAYYGEICLNYFTKNKIITNFYRCLICLAIILSTNTVFVSRVDLLWRLGDFNVAICMILSLMSLVLLRKEVYAATEEYKQNFKKSLKNVQNKKGVKPSEKFLFSENIF